MYGQAAGMQEKVSLITGGTSGIGYATALGLAQQDAHVVIVGRDRPRGPRAVASIQKETANANVSFLSADLSDQAQVRGLAQRFKQRYSRLDVLVNNAGAAYLRRKTSIDGIEMTWALNHLSYFLLTRELFDLLRASAPSRIVNVSSGAHRNASMPFDNLQGEHGYNFWAVYGQSKLANLLFTYELDRRIGDQAITVNALHPGFVATNMGKNNGFLARAIMPIVHLWARSPKEGAETVLYLAASAEMEGQSGGYYYECRQVRSSSISYDPDVAARLWRVSEAMTGVVFGP